MELVEVPEHIAQAIMGLANLADGVREGHVNSFIIFSLAREGAIGRSWFNASGPINEGFALSVMEHGHKLHRQVCRTQGNAPPQNRSEETQ